MESTDTFNTSSSSSSSSSSTKEEELMNHYQELLQTLPQEKNWIGNLLCLYKGFWCPAIALKGMVFFQEHFTPKGTDLILATYPKSGTTWLKALAFSIVNRSSYSPKENNHPLFTSTAHELVPFIEFDFWTETHLPHLDDLPDPRMFATHTPYGSLPRSVKDCGAKVVYICRNPLDIFISFWHFLSKFPMQNEKQVPLEEAFETFCQGVNGFGAFWNHMLGYWKASLEKPNQALFLKYEDMKQDNGFYLKKLASFLGFPFLEEEEKQGKIEDISRLCSFESMKDMEANKSGKRHVSGAPNSAFFRNGKVGDWINYLTPSMVEKMEKIMQEKFQDSGLNFDLFNKCQKDSGLVLAS